MIDRKWNVFKSRTPALQIFSWTLVVYVTPSFTSSDTRTLTADAFLRFLCLYFLFRQFFVAILFCFLVFFTHIHLPLSKYAIISSFLLNGPGVPHCFKMYLKVFLWGCKCLGVLLVSAFPSGTTPFPRYDCVGAACSIQVHICLTATSYVAERLPSYLFCKLFCRLRYTMARTLSA